MLIIVYCSNNPYLDRQFTRFILNIEDERPDRVVVKRGQLLE